jgi:hypothetical protein
MSQRHYISRDEVDRLHKKSTWAAMVASMCGVSGATRLLSLPIESSVWDAWLMLAVSAGLVFGVWSLGLDFVRDMRLQMMFGEWERKAMEASDE